MRKTIIMVLLLAVLLSGCEAKTRILYQGDGLTVWRTGREIILTDGGHVSKMRLRRQRKSSEAKQAQISAVFDEVIVKSIPGGLLVDGSNGTVYIPFS